MSSGTSFLHLGYVLRSSWALSCEVSCIGIRLMVIKNRVPDGIFSPPGNPVTIFLAVRPHYLFPLQPLPPTGDWAGASCVLELFSISVPPAPDFSPLQAVVAQPVTARPAPVSKLAILRPANSFFRSFLSISTSSSLVNKTTLLFSFNFPLHKSIINKTG